MSMPIEYASFLIRLWREVTPPPSPSPERRGARGGVSDWRGEAEHIQTGECWTFDTLDRLLSFLRRQAKDWEAPGQPDESAHASPCGDVLGAL